METALKHAGPHPGVVAGVFALLFITGLSFVVSMNGSAAIFPRPVGVGRNYCPRIFRINLTMCSGVHFSSSVPQSPLGIFTATITSRIRFLGGRVAEWT